jgi:hypothetical protein
LGLLVLELMLLLVLLLLLLLLLLLQTSLQLGDDQCRHVFTSQVGNGYHIGQLCFVFRAHSACVGVSAVRQAQVLPLSHSTDELLLSENRRCYDIL